MVVMSWGKGEGERRTDARSVTSFYRLLFSCKKKKKKTFERDYERSRSTTFITYQTGFKDLTLISC